MNTKSTFKEWVEYHKQSQRPILSSLPITLADILKHVEPRYLNDYTFHLDAFVDTHIEDFPVTIVVGAQGKDGFYSTSMLVNNIHSNARKLFSLTQDMDVVIPVPTPIEVDSSPYLKDLCWELGKGINNQLPKDSE